MPPDESTPIRARLYLANEQSADTQAAEDLRAEGSDQQLAMGKSS